MAFQECCKWNDFWSGIFEKKLGGSGKARNYTCVHVCTVSNSLHFVEWNSFFAEKADGRDGLALVYHKDRYSACSILALFLLSLSFSVKVQGNFQGKPLFCPVNGSTRGYPKHCSNTRSRRSTNQHPTGHQQHSFVLETGIRFIASIASASFEAKNR